MSQSLLAWLSYHPTGHSEVYRRRDRMTILTLLHSERRKLGRSECNRVKEWTGMDYANTTMTMKGTVYGGP